MENDMKLPEGKTAIEIDMMKTGSSNVLAVGWADNTLRVKFKFASYDYDSVPKEIFDKLLLSESIGKFIAANVKGKFEYKKLDEKINGKKIK